MDIERWRIGSRAKLRGWRNKSYEGSVKIVTGVNVIVLEASKCQAQRVKTLPWL